jgi:hypothetical protein
MASRVLNPIEKHGELVGAGLCLFTTTNNIGSFMDSINQIIAGRLHAPEVNNIVRAITGNLIGPIGIAAAGYFAQDMFSQPALKKVGSIVQKAATGYTLVALANYILWYSTHSPGPAGVSGGSSVPSILGDNRGYGY